MRVVFMGTPDFAAESLRAVLDAGHEVAGVFTQPDRPKGRSVSVTLSASSFVPKPFTPFQWEPQDSIEVLRQKQRHLVESIHTRKIGTTRRQASWRPYSRAVTAVSVLCWRRPSGAASNLTAGRTASLLTRG